MDIADQQEIIEGSLKCKECNRVYPITRGVPCLLDIDSDDSDSIEKERTAKAFGYEWTKFHKLHESYEQQFLDWIKPFDRSFFVGKTVLDAGCGTGRHSYFSSVFGASDVIAVDLSSAVDVAYQNTKELGNVHVIQADILSLPLKRVFDFSYSIGVLHHLPVPEVAFQEILKRTKPGGKVSVWIYGYENNAWITKFVNPVRERFMSRISPRAVDAISFLIALPLQCILKIIYQPLNKIKLLKPLSKILPYNDYLYDISKFSFNQNHSIILDHLIAPTACYIKKEEFQKWFKSEETTDVLITWRNKNSWRGSCTIAKGC